MKKLEELRRKFSALLMNTNEAHPIECYIQIGEEEAVGLGSLELPTITEIFQEPKEGIIWLRMEGVKDLMEFDDFKMKDLEIIYNELNEVQ